jgi:hypothetical protein
MPSLTIALVLVLCAASRPEVRVVDHGLQALAFPRYMGKNYGWRDVYNQDAPGRYWLRRELEFHGTRLAWRIGQTFSGDVARSIGRLGLRFAQSGHRVTPTQPRWLATWGRHDEQFPGLLDVTIDGKGLAGQPVALTAGRTGSVGRVHVRWPHVEALFVMLPDDDRLFVEVAITPAAAAKEIAVSLCCWPTGKFRARTASGLSSKLGYGRAVTLSKGARTVLFTDPAVDPTGRRAQGHCALTYFPERVGPASVKRTFPLFVTIRPPIPTQGKTAYVHVVLWEMLGRRGDQAWRYLAEREANTLRQFESLAGMQAPWLATRRRQGLEQARRRLAGMGDAPPKAWAQFYRDEAAYHLHAHDWRAALEAIKASERVTR